MLAERDDRRLGAVQRVALDRRGARWVALREPSGYDEEAVAGRTTFDAIQLLDRLLCRAPGAATEPGGAARLTIAERDVLLAAAWRMAWGNKIAGTLSCGACGEPFDFDFQLDALVDDVRAAAAQAATPEPDGVYRLTEGCRFRLPTGDDELALASLGLDGDAAERALLARCVVEGDAVLDGPAIAAEMERIAGDLDVELAAACSECGHRHSVRFQIQDYLLGAIVADATGLIEDIHRLAQAYRWSLSEILSLPRSRRRALIALLDGELPRPREVM